MLVDYNGQKPMTFTLKSGMSWYIYPKQKDVQISEQDFFHTSKLSRLRSAHPHLFSNLRYDEDVQASGTKPTNKKESKREDFDFNDEKFKPKLDVTGTQKSVMASLARGEETAMGPGERTRKVHKKHVKLIGYQEGVKINPTVKLK